MPSNPAHLNTILRNTLAALVVSFIALSLGASFGIMAERGALAGMISAGIIAFITSAFGGTRIQCSGPTAPMSAVAIVIILASNKIPAETLNGMSNGQFFNFTVILSSIILIILAIFRAGNLIKFIPHSVISGFMSGIAVLIWLGQLKQLFHFDGAWSFNTTILLSLLIALLTLAIIAGVPLIKHPWVKKVTHFFPATLIAIIFCTLLVHFFNIPISTISIDAELFSGTVGEWVSSQIPTSISIGLLKYAIPLAFELALLCYLDTLMTALVMDKLTKTSTKRNKELVAQGAANGICALFGGLPGAQATIRSVLILKEGATSRLAGMLVGVFVLIEIFIFLDLISHIPNAVFIGILFKVGYDVFDWAPIKELIKKTRKQPSLLDIRDVPLIVLTILVTVFWNLSVAAIGATLLFYLIQKITNNALPDLQGIAYEDDEP